MGLIYRWLTIAIQYRKKNIVSRMAKTKRLKTERMERIAEENHRLEERLQQVEQAREQFEVENRAEIDRYLEYQAQIEAGNTPELDENEDPPFMPEFDEKYFFFNFDEEHPQILIPEEVFEDVDNDWRITDEFKDEQVNEYNSFLNDNVVASANVGGNAHHPKK